MTVVHDSEGIKRPALAGILPPVEVLHFAKNPCLCYSGPRCDGADEPKAVVPFLSACGETTGNPMERRQDMREYELYLVIDAEVEEEAVNAIVERVTALIVAGHGGIPGEMIKVDPRGKRRLTFPIKRKLEGLDKVITFQTPPQALSEIERFLKLNEQVLRYLVVRTDER